MAGGKPVDDGHVELHRTGEYSAAMFGGGEFQKQLQAPLRDSMQSLHHVGSEQRLPGGLAFHIVNVWA